MCLGAPAESRAQDAQFTQFYASPLYQNPAFAGTAFRPRIFGHVRHQWPGTGAPFTTYAASGDAWVPKLRAGIGALIVHDRAGGGLLNSQSVQLMYAQQVPLTRRITLQAGGQVGYLGRALGFNRLVYADQFDDRGQIIGTSLDPTADEGTLVLHYPDLSLGGLLYTSEWWLGLSGHHVNAPRQNIYGPEARLPARLTLTGGYVIDLAPPIRAVKDRDRPEKSITLAGLLKQQGPFRQMDIGGYFYNEPLVLGVWYRGLPVLGGVPGVINHDALGLLVGLRQDNLAIGYSYDVNLSGIVRPFGSTHELSIAYTFDAPLKLGNRRARALPCPQF